MFKADYSHFTNNKQQPTFADCRKSKIVNLLCLQGFLPVKIPPKKPPQAVIIQLSSPKKTLIGGATAVRSWLGSTLPCAPRATVCPTADYVCLAILASPADNG